MDARILIIETSSRTGQVALAVGPALVQFRRLDDKRRHAADLAPAVSELLAAQSWKPRDLQAVFVSHGPGSYTGLRVGIMSAKTLAYAVGCKLIAVDTFAAIALQAPPDTATLDVLADAQQDKIYVQRFQRSGEPGAFWSTLAPLAIETFAAWLSRHDPSVWLSGPGLSKFAARLPGGSRIIAPEQWEPHAGSLLRLGLPRLQAGDSDDLWSVEPLYLRSSSAEEKWAQRPPKDSERPPRA